MLSGLANLRTVTSDTLNALRNAQVRRISWVRGVGPAQNGLSGLLV